MTDSLPVIPIISSDHIIEMEILNLRGLHARAAVKMAQILQSFEADVMLSNGNEEWVDACSVMGVMMLGASKGTKIKVSAKGKDAQEALKALTALVINRFGEE